MTRKTWFWIAPAALALWIAVRDDPGSRTPDPGEGLGVLATETADVTDAYVPVTMHDALPAELVPVEQDVPGVEDDLFRRTARRIPAADRGAARVPEMAAVDIIVPGVEQGQTDPTAPPDMQAAAVEESPGWGWLAEAVLAREREEASPDAPESAIFGFSDDEEESDTPWQVEELYSVFGEDGIFGSEVGRDESAEDKRGLPAGGFFTSPADPGIPGDETPASGARGPGLNGLSTDAGSAWRGADRSWTATPDALRKGPADSVDPGIGDDTWRDPEANSYPGEIRPRRRGKKRGRIDFESLVP